MGNDKYINKLIEQFKRARNITGDSYSDEFMREFKEWLTCMQIQGDEYGRFLDKNNIYFATDQYAEVGKGPKDSIAIMYEDMDTTIISPYFEGYKDGNDYRKIINGDVSVIGSIPVLTKESESLDIEIITPSQIKVFMTHNPYDLNSINSWTDLHNNLNNGIILGVYGNTYDKDYEEKVKFMEMLKQSSIMPSNLEGFTINDRYFYVFNTDMYEKGRILAKKK